MHDSLIHLLSIPQLQPPFAPRRVDPAAFVSGWAGILGPTVSKMLAWGVKRLFVWCPMGLDQNSGVIDFFAYDEARAKANFLVDGFVTAASVARNQLDEIIWYGGGLHRLDGLTAGAAVEAARVALWPYIASGGSIGFDASADVTSPGAVAVLHWLTSIGVRWYTEAWPARGNLHTTTGNWICNSNLFDTVNAQEQVGTITWEQPLSQLPGECIELANVCPPALSNLSGQPHLWQQQVIPQIVKAGRSTCACLNECWDNGVTRASLGV